MNTQKDYTSRLMTSEEQSNFSYSRQERIYILDDRGMEGLGKLYIFSNISLAAGLNIHQNIRMFLLCTAQLAQSADVNCNKVFI